MHPPILILLEAAVIAFCSLLLFIARDRTRSFDAITIWSMGMAVGTVGLLLLITPSPRIISNDLALALVLVAAGTAWIAARRFSNLPLHPLSAFAGAATWLILCQIPAFDSAAAQMTVSGGFGSIYSFATAVALWPDGKENLAARPAMLALLIGHGVAYAVRSAAAATGLDEGFRDAFSNTLLIEGQFRVIGMAFLAIALTKQRAELVTGATLVAAHEAVEARRRFLAQMSHEVRTPLNGILGLAQVLARDTRLLPEQRQHVEAVEGAGRHLLAIVNDALDLARIDAGRLDVSGRPFDLQEAADGCLALVRPAAMDKQIALIVEHGPRLPSVVVGDRTRLQQILLNLLWNALRFTPAGGGVTLLISPASGVLVFDVIDTGPGIPLDRRHLLFQDFTQLDPAASEGSGLGLAISARLARQMGGDLTYHPGPNNVGSVFRLELPWAAATPRIEERPDFSQAAPEVASLDVLVVDDVPVNRRLLRAMLAHEGHAVHEAQSAEEALAQVQRRPFDVILLDVHMPETNGIEAARLLRRLPNGRNVPIIAVSADVMTDTVEACLAAGMDAVLAKPIERRKLLEAFQSSSHGAAGAPARPAARAPVSIANANVVTET